MSQFNYRSIKTLEDACKKLGINVEAFLAKYSAMPDHITALASLELITKAVNDGWEHPLEPGHTVYYPWYLLHDRDHDGQSPNADEVTYIRPDGSCGLASADSFNAWSASHATIGSRLACRSREIAEYVAIQFKDLYASWLFPQAWHNKGKEDFNL